MVSSSSSRIENLVTYTVDSSKANQILTYDSGNSKITTLNVEINYQLNDKFRVGLLNKINSYKMDKLANAYSLPQFESKLNLTYNIGDKFLVKLDLFYWGERTGRIDAKGLLNSNYYEVKMDPFVDLNFGVDYRYSKNLSAFIQFNNMANNKYNRFVNYPVYGINILGGFAFTF